MSVFYRQIKSMGTRLEIVIPEIEESQSQALMRRIRQSLKVLEAEISNYDDASEINKINNSEVGESVSVTESVLDIVRRGMNYYSETEGYFDFTLGSWTIAKERGKCDKKLIHELQSLAMDERIELDGLIVKRLNSLVKLDTGGLGKGVAVEVIENLIREAGICSAFISFGGSSVCGIGNHPYGDCWKVGIAHPDGSNSSVGELELRDQTLSVSGNSDNNRKKYGDEGHIINPKDAAYYSGKKLIAVVSDSAFEAEVLSTALIHADAESEKLMLRRFESCRIKHFDCG